MLTLCPSSMVFCNYSTMLPQEIMQVIYFLYFPIIYLMICHEKFLKLLLYFPVMVTDL